MRRADRVEVPCEVEVDLLHRHDLAVTATGRTSLDPEDGSETRLSETEDGIAFAQIQSVGQTHREGRLPFAGRRRADPCNQNESAVGSTFRFGDVERNLRLVVAVRLNVLRLEPDLRSDLLNGAEFCFLGDFDIALDGSAP